MDAASSSSNFNAASSSTDAASSSAVEEITLADVCAFLEASSDSFAADLSAVTDVPVRLPPPTSSGQLVAADYHPRVPSGSTPRGGPAAAVVDGAGSHVCTWPQCGKGFASRWALERHQRNHSNHDSEAHDADSFVERRLRERLRGLQQQLERTREKLGTQLEQQAEAEAELGSARLAAQQQQDEMAALTARNDEMRAELTRAGRPPPAPRAWSPEQPAEGGGGGGGAAEATRRWRRRRRRSRSSERRPRRAARRRRRRPRRRRGAASPGRRRTRAAAAAAVPGTAAAAAACSFRRPARRCRTSRARRRCNC